MIINIGYKFMLQNHSKIYKIHNFVKESIFGHKNEWLFLLKTPTYLKLEALNDFSNDVMLFTNFWVSLVAFVMEILNM